jgi:hypothetical protein
MLILDKQRAIERIVALAEARASAGAALPYRGWRRTPGDVATYQPRPQPAPPADQRAPSRRRVRRGAVAEPQLGRG